MASKRLYNKRKPCRKVKKWESVPKQQAATQTTEMKKQSSPEDAFNDNLTLGLMTALGNVPRICNVVYEKRAPCEKAQVTNWEQRHSVYLPDDMKKFYLSTDGVEINWSYQYSPTKIRRVGYLHIPHLLQITLLRENVESNCCAGGNDTNASTSTATLQMATKDKWGNPIPQITSKTKIFEIRNVHDMAKVCLIYDNSASNNPKFCLLELETMTWQFLADTFSEYWRMALAHLGLPFWELCFSSFGLPAWVEQLFQLLAPHLIEEHEPHLSKIIDPMPEHPYNLIDPNTFRLKAQISAHNIGVSGKLT